MRILFPAHAGVIPCQLYRRRLMLTFPRTRGGDPSDAGGGTSPPAFSPHTRG